MSFRCDSLDTVSAHNPVAYPIHSRTEEIWKRIKQLPQTYHLNQSLSLSFSKKFSSTDERPIRQQYLFFAEPFFGPIPCRLIANNFNRIPSSPERRRSRRTVNRTCYKLQINLDEIPDTVDRIISFLLMSCVCSDNDNAAKRVSSRSTHQKQWLKVWEEDTNCHIFSTKDFARLAWQPRTTVEVDWCGRAQQRTMARPTRNSRHENVNAKCHTTNLYFIWVMFFFLSLGLVATSATDARSLSFINGLSTVGQREMVIMTMANECDALKNNELMRDGTAWAEQYRPALVHRMLNRRKWKSKMIILAPKTSNAWHDAVWLPLRIQLK